MNPTIGYMGMTHLGLCSAAAAAAHGFAVLGYDPDAERVARLRAGDLPVVEPGLPELIAASQRLEFSADAGALARCDVVYIAADVPTDDAGRSDLTGIERLIATASERLRPEAVLVVLSQVPPGFTRTQRRAADRLYYQVETLVFGCAVERATRPERFLVGCARPAEPLPQAYRAFLDAFACPVLPMRYESAELCKISINLCLVASISAANSLAALCERIGADWSEIVPGLRLDRRIGMHAYLEPGLGLSGGNLERDLATLGTLSARTGASNAFVSACVELSTQRRDWPLRVLRESLDLTRARVGVLGLAYKPGTASIKGSPAFALLASLRCAGVRAYDPVVQAELPAGVERAPSALEACRDADAVVVMTPWDELRALRLPALARVMKGRLVVDPYRALDPRACAAEGLRHCTLGAGAESGLERGDARCSTT
jgi:UDPglucose 6-dehydrogenase